MKECDNRKILFILNINVKESSENSVSFCQTTSMKHNFQEDNYIQPRFDSDWCVSR